MTESDIHKIAKEGVAAALRRQGYQVYTEFPGVNGEGRIDVFATNTDGSLVKVEVVNTHIPNWLLIRLGGTNLGADKAIKVSKDVYDRLIKRKKLGQTMDDIVRELLDIAEAKKK